jgi:hypothetical protein
MRAHLIALIPLVLATQTQAQQTPVKATRVDGGSVWLYPNGTWRPDPAVASRPVSGTGYIKPAAATESLDILGRAKLSYDPAKWRRGDLDKPNTKTLSHLKGDGYAMVISERLQVPLATLKAIAIKNARNVDPDMKVVSEENRRVNGVDVLCLQLTFTTQGIPFRYFGYYYAGKEGSIQVVTYTGASLFDEYRPDFEELLNGFQIQS